MLSNIGGSPAIQRYRQAKEKIAAKGTPYVSESISLSDLVQIESSSYVEGDRGTIFVSGHNHDGESWQETFVERQDVPGLLPWLLGNEPRSTLYHYARCVDRHGPHSLFEEFNLSTGETLRSASDAEAENRMAAIREGRGFASW